MNEDLESVAGRSVARERVRAAVVAALVDDRAAILTMARRKSAQIDSLIAGRRMTADEGTLIKRVINVFADEIAQGLHVDHDEADVRAGMRLVLTERADG